MECKDLSLEDMREVRGGLIAVRGGNDITQTSENHGAYGEVGVGGTHFNLSPVDVSSSVKQMNRTAQGAAISDVYDRRVHVGIDRSQLELGFGRWFS